MIWLATAVYMVGFVVTLVLSFGMLCAIERITATGNPLALEVIDWRGDGLTAVCAAIAWPLIVVAIAGIVLYRLWQQHTSKEVA
jgi:hypothetical protein